MLTIEATGLHWLPGMQPEQDICAHGGLVVRTEGQVLVDDSTELWSLSAGALFLLRALTDDHCSTSRVAELLVPHCGHAMYAEDAETVFIAPGCRHGRDWSVRHCGDDVLLDFGPPGAIRIRSSEWRDAVVRFADRVAQFYEAGCPKVPFDDVDAEGYAAYRAELARRLAAAREAV
jgi:hypothetical protein